MVNWKNTKCGTCAIQRQKPICNSCMNYHFYRPMTNAQKIRSMTDEELSEFFDKLETVCDMCACNIGCCNVASKNCKAGFLKWLQSEVEGGTDD